MRGNWEAAEALVLAPGQQPQLQQQPQTIMEDRVPFHSPTTPAWGGIADRIVKEEPTEEDKNDDSGVSPGHYTSSLSPGSATSRDSNTMQCEVAQDTLQCPVCPFTTLNRLQFTEHLGAHYAANCETPDFTKSLLTGAENLSQQQQLALEHHQQLQMEQMDHTMSMMEEDNNRASPSQGERSEQESEEADEPGVRVPRVNSQGKVKTFRCKQCNFVAITKLEFWEHSKGHIKMEKLLTCPKCPFVTEYKHHLEYHLRNHFGSKPFKCDKCSYSCVNKSMLNSHLKSHSNVYQYRCANCSYATKYCHSLKLHLRKYTHKPAMVLNADGSPNPLPIIDVYGTRRGPKQKPSNSISKIPNDDTIAQLAANGGLNQNGQMIGTPQLSPISRNHMPINPMNAMHALTNSVNQSVMGFPYGQLFAGFPMANHYQMNDEATEKHFENLKSNLFAEYAKAMANDRIMSDYNSHQEFTGMNGFSNPGLMINNNTSPKITEIPMTPESPEKLDTTEEKSSTSGESPKFDVADKSVGNSENKGIPLDLSKPDALASNNNNNSNANNNIPSDIASDSNGACSATNSPKTSGTSRRKGRAMKLERLVVENESDAEEPNNEQSSSVAENQNETGSESPNSKETTPERNFGGVGMSNEFTCQYCEIAFGNVVMYTVHMGYHGYKNPYTCNMCGHECDDKVSFFLHIARSKHS